jgi:hypothetical protein
MNDKDEDASDSMFYGISDLGCAAALVCLGFGITSLDRVQNPKRVSFIFRSSKEIQEAVRAYWSGTLRVDARRFFESTKSLKSRLYND